MLGSGSKKRCKFVVRAMGLPLLAGDGRLRQLMAG